MVVERQQPSRKTRPPVGSSELLHHPYVSGAFTKPSTSAKCCPIIEADFGVPESKGRRRRRGKEVKERVVPQYYQPNPRWEGKCRGYGYGYT